MYDEVSFKAEIAGLLPEDLNTVVHKDACWQVYNNAQNPDNSRLVAGRMEHLGDEQIRMLGKTSATSTGSVPFPKSRDVPESFERYPVGGHETRVGSRFSAKYAAVVEVAYRQR